MTGTLTPQKQGAKRATRELNGAAGGVEAGAMFCRVGKSQLSDAGNPNRPDCFMPIDVAIDLQAVTRGSAGWPQVTRFMAQQDGFELVPLPVLNGGPADWMAVIGGVSKEGGDVVSKVAALVAVGLTPDAARKADLVREFDELIRIAVEGRAAVLALLGE